MAKTGQNLVFTSQAPWLEQISGQGQGRLFEMLESRVTIGRSEENQIVVPTEAISRVHAVIERESGGGYLIFDNQSKNGILINGQRVAQAVLQDGDVVQVGPCEFRFVLPRPEKKREPHLSLAGEGEDALPIKPVANKENKRRILIYGAVLLVGAVLYFNQGSETPTPKPEAAASSAKPTVKPTEAPVPPEGAAAAAIKGLDDPTADPLEKEMNGLPWSDSGITESESYFRRGQRDYSNKDYHRAINGFELALSLNPNHASARFYLQQAMHAAEKDAQNQYELGAKYFEALQYQRAIYHFQRTIDLLAHRPKDPVIKEAEKYIKLAQQRLQASELFP